MVSTLVAGLVVLYRRKPQQWAVAGGPLYYACEKEGGVSEEAPLTKPAARDGDADPPVGMGVLLRTGPLLVLAAAKMSIAGGVSGSTVGLGSEFRSC